METTSIRAGERIHVIERRRFESDLRRHFVGEVLAVAGNLIRAKGYIFTLNSSTGLFDKKPDIRTRLFSAADANNIINVLAESVDIERVRYALDSRRNLMVTDELDLRLDVSEFGGAR